MLSDMNRVIMHYSFKKTVYMEGDGRKIAIHQLL